MKFTVQEDLMVFIRESKYEGSLPCFYSITQFPELQPLVDNWKHILDEVYKYESTFGCITGVDTYSPPGISNDFGWSNMYFENFMWRKHRNRQQFPFICSILDKIPNSTYGAISILGPGVTIMPHYGDTNGIIRCHLGLSIPAAYPVCGIRVGSEEQGWEDGKITLFTEAHLHTTWNHSTQKRYVLVVDIVPSFITAKKIDVCSRVLAAQTFNYFEKRIPLLKKIPNTKLKYIHSFLTLLWHIYLPIQRRFKFL